MGPSTVKVLCADLPGLIKRMVCALCETNITFSNSIEITGSLHIKADETRVLALLLDHVASKPPVSPTEEPSRTTLKAYDSIAGGGSRASPSVYTGGEGQQRVAADEHAATAQFTANSHVPAKPSHGSRASSGSSSSSVALSDWNWQGNRTSSENSDALARQPSDTECMHSPREAAQLVTSVHRATRRATPNRDTTPHPMPVQDMALRMPLNHEISQRVTPNQERHIPNQEHLHSRHTLNQEQRHTLSQEQRHALSQEQRHALNQEQRHTPNQEGYHPPNQERHTLNQEQHLVLNQETAARPVLRHPEADSAAVGLSQLARRLSEAVVPRGGSAHESVHPQGAMATLAHAAARDLGQNLLQYEQKRSAVDGYGSRAATGGLTTTTGCLAPSAGSTTASVSRRHTSSPSKATASVVCRNASAAPTPPAGVVSRPGPPLSGWMHAYRSAYQKVHWNKGLSCHTCSLCGMHFQRAPSLAAHINAIHTRERSFKCELCNKVFFRRTAYCNHRRAHHFQPTESSPAAQADSVTPAATADEYGMDADVDSKVGLLVGSNMMPTTDAVQLTSHTMDVAADNSSPTSTAGAFRLSPAGLQS